MLTAGHRFLSNLSKSVYSRAFESSTTLSALKVEDDHCIPVLHPGKTKFMLLHTPSLEGREHQPFTNLVGWWLFKIEDNQCIPVLPTQA